MDDFKNDFSKNRGAYITCGVLALLSFFGGVMAILGPKIGEGNAALLALGVIVFIILLIVIGSVKGVRLAKVILGVLLLVLGLGLMIFFLYDFVTSLVTGESPLNKGLTAENYGTQMFLLSAFGFGLFGLGLFLIGVIK
jgi:cytosine/uracil/thiamine/allantoin permease